MPAPGHAVVVSQDALVEDVDFRRGWTTPYRLGRRALNVALSDLAAMGARPLLCTVTVCAPAATRVDDLLDLQAGLLEAADAAHCPLAGGDLSATTGPLVIDVTVVGEALPARLLRRHAGRPGDRLCVTGVLGRSAAGLALLLGDPPAGLGEAGAESQATWLRAHHDPVPRLREGTALAAAGVRCAGDVSDGLLVDAGRTAAASGLAAELWWDALPLDTPLRGLAQGEASALALGGGEDFELLAAVDPGMLAGVMGDWAGAPLTVVGRLVPGSGTRLLTHEGGTELPLPTPTARHFA